MPNSIKGKKYHYVAHPETGSFVFGSLSEMKSRGDVLVAGDIYLPIGRHFGANHGFGANHIWDEHYKEICALYGIQPVEYNQTDALMLVRRFVSTIIYPGAKVYCEFANIGKYRPAVVCTRVGTVILEQRQIDGEDAYSVVTAFRRPQPRGTLVGVVRLGTKKDAR